MNHFSKQAAMLIRLIGTLMILLGAMGVIYWLLVGVILEAKSPEHASQCARAISSIVFIVVGALFYCLGKPIGRVIGKGLDD